MYFWRKVWASSSFLLSFAGSRSVPPSTVLIPSWLEEAQMPRASNAALSLAAVSRPVAAG